MLSGFYIPLTGNQWNPVYYPLQEKQPVAQALASVDGYYTHIYGYAPADVNDPWQVYSPTVPDWVNDLHELEPEQFYQIYVTGNITWTVAPNQVAAAGTETQLRYPPSTFYGFVPANNTFIPTVDMVVTASVNGNLCGQAHTRSVDGQIGYVIDVLADDLLNPLGCGRPGQMITFMINGQAVTALANWDNTRMQHLDLMNVNGSAPNPVDLNLSNKLYLPLITNQ